MEYIIGVFVSLVSEGAKRSFGTDTLGTMIAVFTLSLLGAAIYTIYSETIWWQTLIQVFVTAGAFHNYIIRRF